MCVFVFVCVGLGIVRDGVRVCLYFCQREIIHMFFFLYICSYFENENPWCVYIYPQRVCVFIFAYVSMCICMCVSTCMPQIDAVMCVRV